MLCQLRRFAARHSAGLRVRLHPSLQSEQIGVIPPDAVISFTSEVHTLLHINQLQLCTGTNIQTIIIIIIIIIIVIKDIYIAQVRKGHKCAMSAEMAVWLRNCLYLYSYLSHN